MIEGQDIDALLIGALYGELTPADEARLVAHLESHPTDRTALDDLTHARSVVRESRIFQVQLEPPQAISALLLQEAARRAPKKAMREETEKESWFHRFLHSFMSHPAMAAAAMLVLVVGVASTLYLKKGDHFADQSAPAGAPVAHELDRAPAASPPSDQWRADKASNGDSITAPTAPGAAAAGSGSAFGADLAERKGGERDEAQRQLALTDKLQAKAEPKVDAKPDTDGKDTRAQQATHNAPKHEGVIVQAPPTLVPREMPEAKTPAPAKVAVDDATKQESTSHGRPGNANSGAAASPPPPAQATAPASSTIARERTADKPTDPAAGEASSLLAWAKDQHVRVQALVKAGKCQDAAQLALDLSARAPDYYAQYVATDRTVRPCASYINDARDKEAEKSQKARAAKRVNANEPAPAQQDSK